MMTRFLATAAAALLAGEAALAAVVPIGRPNGGKPYMKPAVCTNDRCRYDAGSVALGEELRFRVLMAERIAYRRRSAETDWDGEHYRSIFAYQWTAYDAVYDDYEITTAAGVLGPQETQARLADLSVRVVNRSVWMDERGPGARPGVKNSGILFDVTFRPGDSWAVGDTLRIVREYEFEGQEWEYVPSGYWDYWGYDDSFEYRFEATLRIGEAVHPVPAPAGAALLLSGLAALAAGARRRATAAHRPA